MVAIQRVHCHCANLDFACIVDYYTHSSFQQFHRKEKNIYFFNHYITHPFLSPLEFYRNKTKRLDRKFSAAHRKPLLTTAQFISHSYMPFQCVCSLDWWMRSFEKFITFIAFAGPMCIALGEWPYSLHTIAS